MARYNTIFAGPFTAAQPQVREAVAVAAITPGTGIVLSGDNFVQAGASTVGKVYVAQDNYLALKNVDVAWPAGDRIVGLESLSGEFINVLVPTGVNVTKDAELTTNATGRFILAVATKQVMFTAEEAYNNTSGVDQLVRARSARGYIKA